MFRQRVNKNTHMTYSIKERFNHAHLSAAELSQRESFEELIRMATLPSNTTALSVGVGNGFHDYVVFKSNSKIKKIVSTDIVENPVNKEDRKVLFTFNHDGLTDLVSETKKTLKRRSSNWKNQPFVNDLDFIERLQRNENILIAYVESFKIDKDVTFKAVYNDRNLGLGEYSFAIDISGLEHRRCSRFAYAANESL